MRETWDNIADTFREKRRVGDDAFQAAVGGVEQVATLIARGVLRPILFGWTSMHDLCVQQTETQPRNGPYLRISPLPSGMVDFRYIDTAIPHRQWHRVVPPDVAPARLLRFLEQLGWVNGVALQ
jgi:hypothetical protein